MAAIGLGFEKNGKQSLNHHNKLFHGMKMNVVLRFGKHRPASGHTE